MVSVSHKITTIAWPAQGLRSSVVYMMGNFPHIRAHFKNSMESLVYKCIKESENSGEYLKMFDCSTCNEGDTESDMSPGCSVCSQSECIECIGEFAICVPCDDPFSL